MQQHTTRKYLRVFCLLLAALFLAVIGLRRFGHDIETPFKVKMTGGPLPGPGPEYERFTVAEQALPQHDLEESKTRRYVKFTNEIRWLGWNNVLSLVLLHSHLAWKANRSYVFQDYYWQSSHYPWNVPEWPWPTNPLTTLIAGPTVGGPWEEGDTTLRAVRQDFWYKVCPVEDTEIIDTDVGKAPVVWSDGQTVMDHWVKLVRDSPKRCVKVAPSFSQTDPWPQTFDLGLIGTTRILSLWPEFKRSPVSRLLATSPLVESAVDQNYLQFVPSGRRLAFGYNPYERMLAIHIRRGDYVEQCKSFAHWNSTFYGWNLLPEIPDPFTPPPTTFEGGHAPAEHVEAYMKRCLPTNDYILDKVEEVQRAWERTDPKRRLDILYVMTNANQEWIDDFKRSLARKNAKWELVVTSKDLVLDFEQTGVNQAVDMELARKAAVYIGMGWSSMTSNILHRRLVDGREPLANRLW